MIYLDNAATTRPCPAALDAMRTALEDAWGNPSALYRPGQQARKLVEDARRTVARVLHAARPAEITFTSGGTKSDVQALYTGAALGTAAGKRHIISTQIEHHAVLHTLQALQTQGFTVTLLPPSAAGLITPQQLADALQPDTCLVSIMFANNEIGTVQPIAELGALCREHGALFHTDAVQAAGHLAIDVQTCSAFPATSSTGQREPVRYIPGVVLPCRMCCTAAARSAATARALRTYPPSRALLRHWPRRMLTCPPTQPAAWICASV